jgi:hypothetical protein
MAVTVMNIVFWDEMPFSVAKDYQRFGRSSVTSTRLYGFKQQK